MAPSPQVVGSNDSLGFEDVGGQVARPVVADLSGGSNVVHIIDTVSVAMHGRA